MLKLLSSIDIDGRRGRVIRWGGCSVRVYDDACTALRIIALFRDEEVSSEAKQYILLRLLFPNPEAVESSVSDLDGLVSAAVWEVAGIDADGSHSGEYGERIIDWDGDADAIEASLWQAYSMPIADIASKVSLSELGNLVGMAPHDTPIGQAIYYRTAEEPQSTKYNQDDIARFRKLRDAWALGGASDDDSANSQATTMFGAFKRASNG